MKRLVLTIATAGLLITSIPYLGSASGPFDQRLSQDQQIVQALNRLTFGPRPGDIEEVRGLGVAKWIELQLHPEQIPENPVLDARLKPLETLRMDPAQILKDYGLPQPIVNQMAAPMRPQNPALTTAIRNATTPEQRAALLKALDPEERRPILAQLPPDMLAAMPEFQKEGEEARRMQQEDAQKEARKRNPQLQDLLDPDQVAIAQRGNKEQLTALLAYLDPEKRAQVAAALPQQALADFPELRREAMLKRPGVLQGQQLLGGDLKEGKVYRALYSNRQLEEVLVDFWFNHFNVYEAKNVQQVNNPNALRAMLASYEQDAIRPHVLGHFKDLLLATSRHPAMLYYLDNWESMAPGSFDVGPFAPRRGFVNGVANAILPGNAGQAHGLNENYGREIMELHTLGVNGGYTQADVIAVARCFTGWTVRDPGADPEFVFASFMHDTGEKTVLGHKIAGGAEQDGLQVIDILAHHPSTAKFISRELAQRFVADDPPQALVDRMAQTFTKTDGDLRAVLETMFTSPEFFSEGAWQSKVKSPFEMVVSAVRALGGEASDSFTLVQKIADLGEPLYNYLAPTGYPNTGEAWLSTSGMIGRMNFSAALASGLVPGVKVDSSRLAGKDAAAIARDVLGRDASPQTQAALEKGVEGKDLTPPFIASLVLGSPDFQRR
jgi:uncharacterized protein (DUF1800 family)